MFNEKYSTAYEIKFDQYTCDGMACMLATIITIKSPNDTVSSQIAWTTDFSDVGAWKYRNRLLKLPVMVDLSRESSE